MWIYYERKIRGGYPVSLALTTSLGNLLLQGLHLWLQLICLGICTLLPNRSYSVNDNLTSDIDNTQSDNEYSPI